jgi:hypothetical protein
MKIYTLKSWLRIFNSTGKVAPSRRRTVKKSRWPDEVLEFVRMYTADHPCFYIEELQTELVQRFPTLGNISMPTVCRALKHDLKLSRKILSKRARQALPREIRDYFSRLKSFVTNSDQLVFVDETSKDGRSAVRKYAWSTINKRAIVNLPYSRGTRVSALCAMDCKGFFASVTTSGTFTRMSHHSAMVNHIIPKLNPYPAPRSILILDNAKIHMYNQLIEACHAVGALIFFLPPYCPQFNPIEVGFSVLKSKIQKHANMAFKDYPEDIIKALLPTCFINGTKDLFEHCGYGRSGLILDYFEGEAREMEKYHSNGNDLNLDL